MSKVSFYFKCVLHKITLGYRMKLFSDVETESCREIMSAYFFFLFLFETRAEVGIRRKPVVEEKESKFALQI